jgi:hypothetical protein
VAQWESWAWAGIRPTPDKKFLLVEQSGGAPELLCVGIRAYLAEILGPHVHPLLLEGAVKVAAQSLEPSTWSQYISCFKKFVRFCAVEHCLFLPASQGTVLKYVLFLADEGVVNAGSCGTYFAAVNKFHDLSGFEKPAVGVLFEALKKGWSRMQVAVEPLAFLQAESKIPCVPATVVLRMYDLLPSVPVGSDEFRALVYVVVAFRVFLRPATLLAITWSQVLEVDGRAALRFASDRWKTGRAKGLSDVRMPSVDLTDLPHLRAALDWAVGDSGGTQFFGFTSVETGNRMFQRALELVRPDLLGKFSQYSCRRGGASAAYAVGVPIDVIESVGFWARNSTALRDHYIDRSTGASEAASFFFKSLLPGSVAPAFGAPLFH